MSEDENEKHKKDIRRKVIYQNGTFQLIKPCSVNNGQVTEWHGYGQQKSIKSVYDIITRGDYEIVGMDDKTKEELIRYEKQMNQNKTKENRQKESKLVGKL